MNQSRMDEEDINEKIFKLLTAIKDRLIEV